MWLQGVVMKDSGGQDEWGIERGAPFAMLRAGWKPSSVQPAEKITVVLNPLKSGDKGGNLLSVTRADGSVTGQ